MAPGHFSRFVWFVSFVVPTSFFVVPTSFVANGFEPWFWRVTLVEVPCYTQSISSRRPGSLAEPGSLHPGGKSGRLAGA